MAEQQYGAAPVDVVRRYLDEIYHAGRTELVREITADGVVRHDPGGTRTLDHDAQIARIEADLPQWSPWFTGDPRVDNVLFEPVADGWGAVLIDWQVTGLRNPMYDVGYFLSGSLGVDDRRAHEPRLIEHYLREFAAIDPSYPADEALEDYRTQVLSGLMITTAAIAVLPDVEQVNTLILALLERNCAAVADWDAVEATRYRAG